MYVIELWGLTKQAKGDMVDGIVGVYLAIATEYYMHTHDQVKLIKVVSVHG